MAKTVIQSIPMKQGETLLRRFRWLSPEIVFVPITDITKAAPVIIEAPGHGLKTGMVAWVSSVQGMTQINIKGEMPEQNEYKTVQVVDADIVKLPYVNALSYSGYSGSGVLCYRKPYDLADYDAVFGIYSVETGAQLHRADTWDQMGITINTVDQYIDLRVSDEVTSAINEPAEYQFELIYKRLFPAERIVSRIMAGSMPFSEERIKDAP